MIQIRMKLGNASSPMSWMCDHEEEALKIHEGLVQKYPHADIFMSGLTKKQKKSKKEIKKNEEAELLEE